MAAIGAIVLTVLPSHAATPPASAPNDIFVGVRSTVAPGKDFSYLVKIGTYATFRDVPEGSSITLNLPGIGTDLSGITPLGEGFGATWHTREDVQWGIFGWSNVNDPTLFASRPRPSASVPSNPWDAMNDGQRSSTKSSMFSVQSNQATGALGYDALDVTPNNPAAVFQPNSAAASSYKQQVSGGASDFGSLSGWDTIEAHFGNGPSGALLDLYRITNSATTPVTRLGYFSISSAGTITFTKPTTITQPDPNADDDHDGFTNGQEAIAGTNPNNPNDFFHVQSVVRTVGQDPLVAFKPVANRTYSLLYSENLQPPWTKIKEFVAGSTPPFLHTFVDDDDDRTSRTKGFYRISVELTN